MTSNSFLLGGVPPGMADLGGNVVRWPTQVFDRLRALVRQTIGMRQQVIDCSQIAYLDDRMLRDIGLRHDAMPCVVHERVRESVARLTL
jgi:hypothetical protein